MEMKMEVVPAQVIEINNQFARIITETGERIKFSGDGGNGNGTPFKAGENVFLVKYKIGIFLVKSMSHVDAGKKVIDNQITNAIMRNECAACRGSLGSSQTGLCSGCMFKQAMNPVANVRPPEELGIKLLTAEEAAAKIGISVDDLKKLTQSQFREDQN